MEIAPLDAALKGSEMSLKALVCGDVIVVVVLVETGD